jgi:hypothetical protein
MARDIKALVHRIPINISLIGNKNSYYLLLDILSLVIENTLKASLTYCQENNITPSNLQIFILFIPVDGKKQIKDIAYFLQKININNFLLHKKFKEVGIKLFLEAIPNYPEPKYAMMNFFPYYQEPKEVSFPNYNVFYKPEHNHLMFIWKEIINPHGSPTGYWSKFSFGYKNRTSFGYIKISNYMYFINYVLQLTLNKCQNEGFTTEKVDLFLCFLSCESGNERQKLINFLKNIDPNNFPLQKKFKRVEFVCMEGFAHRVGFGFPDQAKDPDNPKRFEIELFLNYRISMFRNNLPQNNMPLIAPSESLIFLHGEISLGSWW